MHNMIIDDKGAMNLVFNCKCKVNSYISVSHSQIPKLNDFLQTHNRIRDITTRSQLQEDLIEHLWEQYINK
jgi:Holliday junction resolvase